MKVLVDMNLSPRGVAFLTDAGIEAVHWSTIGAGDAPDVDIMVKARQEGMIVLTNDLDFGEILATNRGAKPSVVQLRTKDNRTQAVGQAGLASLRQMTHELDAGALLTIEPDRARIRLLPFQ